MSGQRRRARRWTIAVFVMATLICFTFIGLHFEHLRTHDQISHHIDSFRQTSLDLHRGFIELSLANEGLPFDRASGLALLDQALRSFEQQAAQFEQNGVVITGFFDELESFRTAIQGIDSNRVDSQTRIALWIALDRLQSYAEALDEQTLAHLETQVQTLANVFLFAVGVSTLLFFVIGYGVYRAEIGRDQSESALEQSQARYRAIVEDQSELINRFTPDFRLTYCNAHYSRLYGKSPEEMIGLNLLDLMPEPARSFTQASIQALSVDQPLATSEGQVTLADGSIRWQEWIDRAIFVENGIIIEYQGVGRDITERKEAELTLERSLARLRALSAIDSSILNADTLEETAERAVRSIAQIMPVHRITLLGIDEETRQAHLLALHSELPETELPAGTVVEMLPNEAEALKQEEYLLITALDAYPTEAAQSLYAEGVRSILSIGLRQEGRLIGALNVHATREDFFTGDSIAIPREIASQLAVAIHTMRLNDQIRRHAAELEKRVEQRTHELRLEKTRTEAILQSSSDGIVLLDATLRIRQANQAFREIFGCSDPADQERSLIDHIHPDDRDLLTHRLEQTLREALVQRCEVRALRQDKPIFTEIGIARVDEVGSDAPSLVCTIRNITVRKLAEEKLADSERRYRSLIETMHSGFAVFDVDDRFTYVNDQFCEIVGYGRDELIGTLSTNFVDLASRERIASQLTQRRQMERGHYEVVAIRKEGRPVHLLISASPLLDANGSYGGSSTVVTDISAEKAAAEALQRALEQEKELGQLKSRFVSMASHEFRTPLAAIATKAETLLFYRDRLSDDQQTDRLKGILQQVDHMKEIMDNVLQLARIHAGRVEFKPEVADLKDFCTVIIEEFRLQPENQARILFDSEGSSLKLAFDKRLMRHLVSNLIANALKYSSAEETVSITLRAEAAAITLRVEDRGIGIPDADLKHLYEPFHRASNVGTISGTGLGMSITKEAVEMHGGTIEVMTKVDAGTTFTVRLPVAVN